MSAVVVGSGSDPGSAVAVAVSSGSGAPASRLTTSRLTVSLAGTVTAVSSAVSNPSGAWTWRTR
jgi:hypothetical protein